MFTQTKKKIYIIGSNPRDFYDLTIESVEILSEVDLIILSRKFEKTFMSTFKKNDRKFIFEDDLTKRTGLHLWQKVLDLFSQYKTIAHLRSGDSLLFNNGNEQKKFFESHNIKVKIILGIIEVVNWLNNESDLLTNRQKNSSITFFEKFNLNKIFKVLKYNKFEKLVVKIDNNNDYISALKLIEKNKIKNIYTKIIRNGNFEVLEKKIKIKSPNDYLFLIIEKWTNTN